MQYSQLLILYYAPLSQADKLSLFLNNVAMITDCRMLVAKFVKIDNTFIYSENYQNENKICRLYPTNRRSTVSRYEYFVSLRNILIIINKNRN